MIKLQTLEGAMVARMARAICDADPTLEDSKWGRRCRTFGCVAGTNTCIAFKQATAAARALETMLFERAQRAA
ncbi:MAG: hypothetical protein ACHQK9_14350 [Reyranellales bacterium]